MKSYSINIEAHGPVTIRVGDTFESVIGYVSKKKRVAYADKVGRSRFIMPIGHSAILSFDLAGNIEEVKQFKHSSERQSFLDSLAVKEANLSVSLHVLERLRDRYSYTKNYSLQGLLNTAVRAVKNSRVGFKTTSGKVIRIYGKHMFVVIGNDVVTLLPPRAEFYIYEEAYRHSGVLIPDILVSKYVGNKVDTIMLKRN